MLSSGFGLRLRFRRPTLLRLSYFKRAFIALQTCRAEVGTYDLFSVYFSHDFSLPGTILVKSILHRHQVFADTPFTTLNIISVNFHHLMPAFVGDYVTAQSDMDREFEIVILKASQTIGLHYFSRMMCA